MTVSSLQTACTSEEGEALVLYSTEDRPGSEEECEYITSVLKANLNIQPSVYRNPTRETFLASLDWLMENLSETKCFVIIAMMFHSADSEEDAIKVGGETVKVKEILEKLSDYREVIKIVLAQCCRGTEIGNRMIGNEQEMRDLSELCHPKPGGFSGSNVKPQDNHSTKKLNYSNLPDNTILYFSTLPNDKSRRGVWFREMKRYMTDVTNHYQRLVPVDFREMMDEVARRVKEQTRLTRHINSVSNCDDFSLLLHPDKKRDTFIRRVGSQEQTTPILVVTPY